MPDKVNNLKCDYKRKFLNYTYTGLTFSMTILLGWLLTTSVSLFLFDFSLSTNFILDPEKSIIFVALVCIQTILYTGMFITAHDAMHGLVFPRHKTINDGIGILALILFALFDFQKLRKEHWNYHNHTATSDDPDSFLDGKGNVLLWYFHFLLHYMSLKQIFFLAVLYNILIYVFKVPAQNLYIFCLVPSVISSFQLFYFGTYLPHKLAINEEYQDKYKAKNSNYNRLVSLITCYHFGYHLEHHEFPFIPWWKLHQAKLLRDVQPSLSSKPSG